MLYHYVVETYFNRYVIIIEDGQRIINGDLKDFITIPKCPISWLNFCFHFHSLVCRIALTLSLSSLYVVAINSHLAFMFQIQDSCRYNSNGTSLLCSCHSHHLCPPGGPQYVIVLLIFVSRYWKILTMQVYILYYPQTWCCNWRIWHQG